MQRVVGLDAIRFICALVVALFHFHYAVGASLSPLIGSTLGEGLDTVLANSFNGPAAVAVFFVLSGFVIHLPQARGRKLDVAQFAARRGLRIVPPILAFMLLSALLGTVPPHFDWMRTILWSVICELGFYAVYPLLVRTRIRMHWIAVGSLVIAALVTVVGYHAIVDGDLEYFVFGWWTPVVGLPIWLLGAVLAEHYTDLPVLSTRALRGVRAAVVVSSVILLMVKFHGGQFVGPLASNLFLLTLYSIPLAAWIGLEAVYHSAATTHSRTLTALDRAGAASYSLYLVHSLVLTTVGVSTLTGGLTDLVLYACGTAAATVAFYLAVERPSVRLAHRTGRALAERHAARQAPDAEPEPEPTA
ncbi:acyltransferase family protein [Demequina subtropica]|uniref:acyltransferase family protein n=1 Tax=Demequina subtropica TaxID=1638989 RepID=UPI0009E4E7F9|nr:acyltransferase [Demequina subtropica]